MAFVETAIMRGVRVVNLDKGSKAVDKGNTSGDSNDGLSASLARLSLEGEG